MPNDRDREIPESVTISFELNGKLVGLQVNAAETALSVLRDRLGLKGPKEGCGIGECGACTVLVDGLAVDACLLFAPQLDGRTVETVEGLADRETLNPLQQAFLSHDAVQCGYCTPGMLMSAKALLQGEAAPGRKAIVEALSGNLCRCTGYLQIIEAVEAAAAQECTGRDAKE
ncbi:MAG: (2Fe-2S)-binding protein [Desulfomonile tiedjei]|nr:(2Fe-2S)-binding protein [Desulfomonile tiedjei]